MTQRSNPRVNLQTPSPEKFQIPSSNSVSQFLSHIFCDVDEGLAGRLVGFGNDYGHALIAAFADFGEEGDFAEETDVLALGFGASAAVAEDFDALAAGGGEIAHVFDDAEDGNIHFLKHGDA